MSNTNAPVLILVIFLIIAALVAVGFFVFSNNGGRRSLGGSDNKRQKTGGGGGGGGSGGGVSGSGGGGGIITLPTVNSGTDTDDEFVPNRELSPREKMDLRRLVKSKLLEDLEQKPESYYEDMATPKFNTLADELEPKLKEDFSASDQLEKVDLNFLINIQAFSGSHLHFHNYLYSNPNNYYIKKGTYRTLFPAKPQDGTEDKEDEEFKTICTIHMPMLDVSKRATKNHNPEFRINIICM